MPTGRLRLVEETLKHLSTACRLRHIINWYFNVVGVDPDSEISEFQRPETHLISLTLSG